MVGVVLNSCGSSARGELIATDVDILAYSDEWFSAIKIQAFALLLVFIIQLYCLAFRSISLIGLLHISSR